ncbi:tRNA(Met) cytidine acetyltransferase [Thiomicrorhabdus sp. 6S3-12]|nr:tRNA(Met) cytidine acetyltransferase [Thiomicrorhabdus sp. 6S3-12]
MMHLDQPLSYLRQQQQTLQQRGHRALCILQGDTNWAQALIDALCSDARTLAIGDFSARENLQEVAQNQLKHWLGQEFSHVLVSVAQGLRADTLGIVSGMIRAGGFLILVTPPDWPEIPNPENKRFLNSPLCYREQEPWFYRQLVASWQNDVIWIRQQDDKAFLVTELESARRLIPTLRENHADGAATQEQHQAIQMILKVAFGHRKRPLVLSADRGRGKSAALGLAAVQALIKGKQRIAISAAAPEQTQTAFAHAQQWLERQTGPEFNKLKIHKDRIEFEYGNQSKQLKFYAPDYLHLNQVECDLLLIDEAAQIPTPLLAELLQKYHRTVFSTTLHGYEGSGRGFELRFTKTLHKLTPDWTRLHLLEPLRWNSNDPLEKAINQALLLQSADQLSFPPHTQTKQQLIQQIVIKPICKSELIERLPQIFGLLVKAHYQTSPNDLQQLLDAPNHLWAAYYHDQTVGILLSQQEGDLENAQSLHGHLVPQLLNRQYAFGEALQMRSWRLMRIAVEPQWQNFGVGSLLVQAWQDAARLQQIDFLSSSFGADSDLIRFWLKQKMRPLHLGCKRDKASGSYNLVVYQPLKDTVLALENVRREFYRQLPFLLSDELKELEFTQLRLLLEASPDEQHQDFTRSRTIVSLYLQGKRPFTTCSAFIHQFILQQADLLTKIDAAQGEILNDKLLKRLDWTQLAEKHHLNGKKQAEQAFKKALTKTMEQETDK